MEMISKPLALTERENREMLAEPERRRKIQGYADGNRHDRRVAARHDRLKRSKEETNVGG